MKGWALHERMAQCGVTVREVADLLGVHPHQLDHDSLRGLPELPVRVLIDLARRLDLHPADLLPDLEPVLAHHRQDAEHEPQAPAVTADPRVVLAALAHAGTPMHTYTLCQALDWPHPRLKAALDHLRAHPDAAGAWALRRTGAHTYVLGARMDLLTEQQRAALEKAAGRVIPIGAEEAGVLAALLGFGPPPRGADWDAGARGLAEAGLAAEAAEGGFAIDPDIRFSLFPGHSPSVGEEAEVEH
ncbi:helix-turn-helix domain-containing protein [Nocardiopsis sp. NPDC055824]